MQEQIPTQPDIPAFVHDELNQLGIELAPPLLARLAQFLDLLLEANARFNLTAIRDREQAWRRHIIDGLTPLFMMDDLPEDARVIDVGSGGGLPGMVLAVARPDLHFVLLDATGKKCRFVEEAAQTMTLANVSVLNMRAETAGQDPAHRQRYDAAVCRAVGPMRILLEYTLPLVKVGGRLLAMKGPSVEGELRDAGDALALLGGGEVQVIDAYPPAMDNRSVIVRVDKAEPTPREYPRLPGTPKSQPL